MANITVSYTFANSTVADATEVNTNFQNIISGTSDGTKDFSINALTLAGAFTANGNCTFGNASGDDITFTGSLASTIPIKTDNSFDIGGTSTRLRNVYATGYYGIQTNTAAGTGFIGQILSGIQTTAQNAAADNTYLALTSVSLTAGDWDVEFRASLFGNGATMRTGNANQVVIGTTSASSAGTNETTDVMYLQSFGAACDALSWGGFKTLTIASTTTYYLNVLARFSAGTPQWKGYIIARRRR